MSTYLPIGAAKSAAPVGRQPTNAELIRQSQSYGLVESDDEDFAKAVGSGGGSSKKKVRRGGGEVDCIVKVSRDDDD